MNFLKKHYHWVIAGVILLELAIHIGIFNNVSSLFIIPVTADLQIPRGSFSLAYSCKSLAGFFSTLFSGIFFAKFGYRKLATAALLLSAGAYVLLSSSQDALMLGIGFLLIGLGEGFSSVAASTRMVNTWFHTHQGLVLGLVTASTGLGGSLFSIILSNTIASVGWRSSYLLCGVLVLVSAALILLFIRNTPREMELLPYGSGNHHGKKAKRENRDHWYGYESKDIMKKPTFFLMMVVIFLSCFCNYAAFYVIVPHFQDCGLGATDAAALQSIMLLALAAAKFICGILSDTLGAKFINVLCMVCTILALILLAVANSYATCFLAVLIYSVALVMTSIPVPLLSSALFGYHPQSSMIGIFMALIPASSVIAAPVVNTIYDHIGSYRPIFLVSAGVGAVALLLMVLLFILADWDRKRYEQSHPELSGIEEAV